MSSPPAYSVIILPEVYQDLDRIDQFYRAIGAELAERAVDSISQTIETLGDYPGPYRYPQFRASHDQDLREAYAPFGKEGFLVRYRIDEQRLELVVYRVHHAREDRFTSE